MNANNLTISVPNLGCNKNCPYCVSKMTGMMESNFSLMQRNIPKVTTVARAAGVTSVLFTGKGEPLLNFGDLLTLLERFCDWPCELQTNGLSLLEFDFRRSFLALASASLDTLAVSIDRLADFERFRALFSAARDSGLNTRATLNVTRLLSPASHPEPTLSELLSLSRASAIDQLTLRNISIPEGVPEDDPRARWIRDNSADALFGKLVEEVRQGRLVRMLPYGAKAYDLSGISVAFFEYCVQDRNSADDIRSLIFQEDGHLYTTWNSRASILL